MRRIGPLRPNPHMLIRTSIPNLEMAQVRQETATAATYEIRGRIQQNPWTKLLAPLFGEECAYAFAMAQWARYIIWPQYPKISRWK